MKQKLEPGQVWEVRGWGKVGTFILVERHRKRGEMSRWTALCVETSKSVELWNDFADDEEYATKVA